MSKRPKPTNIDVDSDSDFDEPTISLPFSGNTHKHDNPSMLFGSANLTPANRRSSAESPSTALAGPMSNMFVEKGPKKGTKKGAASRGPRKSAKKAFGDSPHGEPPNEFNGRGSGILQSSVMAITKEEKQSGQVIDPLEINLDSVGSFLTTPVEKNKCVMCYVMRIKSGMFNKYPTWHLFVDPLHRSHANKFLCAAKRKVRSKTSNYSLSLDKDEFDKNKSSHLGKMSSNFLGTEYTVFGGGNKMHRSEIACIVFENNIMKGGPRQLGVCCPPLDRKKHSDLLGRKRDILGGGERNGYLTMVNKKPVRNEQKKCFELSFNGRVVMPSTKNFQLVSDESSDDRFGRKSSSSKKKSPPPKSMSKAKGWDASYDLNQSAVLLQFGKVDSKRFNLDVTYPLSPLQAFSLCIANCDSKLACE